MRMIIVIYDCIIIGAGASGMFFAGSLNKRINGLILEKTRRPGTKLLMSGSGQCNITHSGSIKDHISCYGENGKKIRTCLYRHSNLDLIELLEQSGVKTTSRSDGKVFPASMDAHEVLDLLMKKSRQNGFDIQYDSPVISIRRISAGSCENDTGRDIWEIRTTDGCCRTYAAVIASGGCSYPSTGSDGSLFKVLQDDLGLKITKLRPALSSIHVIEYPYGQLSGISFTTAGISIMRNDKVIARNNDAMLLTHNDLSGPAILDISKYALPGDTLIVNYLYPMTYESILADIKKAASASGKDLAGAIAAALRLPKRFCQLMTARYGNSPKKLAGALTGERFTIESVSGFGKAMATSGGIDLSEINTSTMELRKHPGIFAIGEVCDIDGKTGGYNLQFAYSSAAAAAEAMLSKQ